MRSNRSLFDPIINFSKTGIAVATLVKLVPTAVYFVKSSILFRQGKGTIASKFLEDLGVIHKLCLQQWEEGEGHEMSMLLNKSSESCKVKLYQECLKIWTEDYTLTLLNHLN